MDIVLPLRLLQETQRQLGLKPHPVAWPVRPLSGSCNRWLAEPRPITAEQGACLTWIAVAHPDTGDPHSRDGCHPWRLPQPIGWIEMDRLGRWRGWWWPPYWHQWIGPQALRSLRVAGAGREQAGIRPRELPATGACRHADWTVLLAGEPALCHTVALALNTSRCRKSPTLHAAPALVGLDRSQQLLAHDVLVWLGGDAADRASWLACAQTLERPVALLTSTGTTDAGRGLIHLLGWYHLQHQIPIAAHALDWRCSPEETTPTHAGLPTSVLLDGLLL